MARYNASLVPRHSSEYVQNTMPAIQCSQNLCSFLSFVLLLLDVSKISCTPKLSVLPWKEVPSPLCMHELERDDTVKRPLNSCMNTAHPFISLIFTQGSKLLWMLPQSGNLALLVTKHPGLQILKLACQFHYSNNFFPNFMT